MITRLDQLHIEDSVKGIEALGVTLKETDGKLAWFGTLPDDDLAVGRFWQAWWQLKSREAGVLHFLKCRPGEKVLAGVRGS